MFLDVIFYSSVTLLITSAVGVITSNNPVYSALFLVSCFFQSAILWLLIEAEFLAIALIVIYVGAVMVLFLYVVMMMDTKKTDLGQKFSGFMPLGIVVAILLLVELIYAISSATLHVSPVRISPEVSNTQALGYAMYTQHLVAFEIASLILLIGIIAAISLTLHRREGLKRQSIAQQVSVSKADRLKIIKVNSHEQV